MAGFYRQKNGTIIPFRPAAGSLGRWSVYERTTTGAGDVIKIYFKRNAFHFTLFLSGFQPEIKYKSGKGVENKNRENRCLATTGCCCPENGRICACVFHFAAKLHIIV